MKNTIITVIDYPDTFSFVTSEKLPKFKVSDPNNVRHPILLEKLRSLKIDSPCHDYEDYDIEDVEKKYGQEFWYLCS